MSKQKSRKISCFMSVVSAMLLLLFLSSCAITGQTFKDTETVKIGVIGTLTGVGAYQGQEELKGLTLAQDEINNIGGIKGKKIQLIIEDSKASPKDAVTAINKLIFVDDVKYVIGDSWSSTTIAMVPIANENKVILISPIATLDSLSNDDYFFRTIPTTKEIMDRLAEYAYSSGSRKVAIMAQATPFGEEHSKDFSQKFESLGGEIVAEESFDLLSTDLRNELTKVNAKKPDTIFNLAATGPMLGLLQKQAIEQGIKARWISTFGAENTPLIEQYGDVVDGLIYPYQYNAASDNKYVQSFIAKYKQRYNETPSIGAADSYDALFLLALAIEKSDGNPDNVKVELLKIKDYPGASGTLSFDSNGDVNKEIIIKQIKDKKFVRIS